MRILLLGANGQVGHELLRTLPSLGELVATTRNGGEYEGHACEAADLDRPGSLTALVERIAPDVVVNVAAYTAVDRAEDDAASAYRVNAESPAILAEACTRLGARLVHYSTDYVFDGQGDRPYREDDPTAPLGVYGASKQAGEEAIRIAGGRHMIFRTAWVYGSHGHNFLKAMLRVGSERDELRVVADQVGTPTPAALIANATAGILRDGGDLSGIWNLTANGETSWHGFAEAIFQGALRRGLIVRMPRVLPITTAEYLTRAQRPRYSRLDTARITRDFGVELPDWRDGLENVLASIAS